MLLQTASVLLRPWVLVELFTGLRHGLPLVPVLLQGRGYDFEATRALLSDLPNELERLHPGTRAEVCHAMHMCTCTHAHVHTRTHAHLRTCTHAHTHTCTHACPRPRSSTLDSPRWGRRSSSWRAAYSRQFLMSSPFPSAPRERTTTSPPPWPTSATSCGDTRSCGGWQTTASRRRTNAGAARFDEKGSGGRVRQD